MEYNIKWIKQAFEWTVLVYYAPFCKYIFEELKIGLLGTVNSINPHDVKTHVPQFILSAQGLCNVLTANKM